jgi:hypothetical protein
VTTSEPDSNDPGATGSDSGLSDIERFSELLHSQDIKNSLTKHRRTGEFKIDGLTIGAWLDLLRAEGKLPASPDDEVAALLQGALEATHEEVSECARDEQAMMSGCMLVLNTNFWMRLSEIQRVRLTITAGLLADLITTSPVTGVATSLALAVWTSVRYLSDEQVEILKALQRLCGGRFYSEWTDVEDLLAVLPRDQDRKHYMSLLATLKNKGILEEGAGMWRAVR